MRYHCVEMKWKTASWEAEWPSYRSTMGVLFLLIKDRKEKMALLLGESMEFGNPWLSPVLLKDFLFKSEQVPPRTHMDTMENGAVSPFLLLSYNTVKVRGRIELQGSKTRENPSHSGNPFIQKLSLKSWLWNEQMFFLDSSSKMETLGVRQTWNQSERCE